MIQSYGISVDKLLHHRNTQSYLLRQLLRLECYCVENEMSLTWKLRTKQFPFQFFSEVVMFGYKQNIWLIGPYFLNPKDRPITMILEYDVEQQEFKTITTTGKTLNPFLAFKRMPIYFTYGRFLYLAYSNFETNKYCIDKLDLETYEWIEVIDFGQFPPARDYIDGCSYQGFFYVSGNSTNHVNPNESGSSDNIVHRLNLDTNQWSIVESRGNAPTSPNGSSIFYKNNLIVFSKEGESIHCLDLLTFQWMKYNIDQRIPEFNCRRHSHLIQVWGDELILLRSIDEFQFNVFDLKNKEWRVIDTVGKRPNKVRTEPTMIILGSTLYALGGQSGKNHLLSMNLTPPELNSKSKSTLEELEWVKQMYQDGYEDIEFIFEDGKCLKAHRTLLCSKNEYFKSLLGGNFLENNSKSVFISETSSEEFEELIKYYYFAFSFETTKINLVDLYEIAGKFMAIDFQEEIGQKLVNSLEIESGLETLRAFTHIPSPSSEGLKEKTLQFIKKNIKEICETPLFQTYCKMDHSLIKNIFASF